MKLFKNSKFHFLLQSIWLIARQWNFFLLWLLYVDSSRYQKSNYSSTCTFNDNQKKIEPKIMKWARTKEKHVYVGRWTIERVSINAIWASIIIIEPKLYMWHVRYGFNEQGYLPQFWMLIQMCIMHNKKNI